jgi:CheY-like chemotaxis protein
MSAGSSLAGIPALRTLRVLVVDDDPITREGLAVVLQREGHDAILAANGKEALTGLRAGSRPDVILLDMLMPVLDGWHFLDRFRAEAPTTAIPIILVTTLIVICPEWAQAHGCCGVIHKPIDPEELLKEIRRCLPEIGGEHQ